MSHFELVQKLFPTFMMIIVICIAGYIKTSIKEDRLRNAQRKVLIDKVTRENDLLERERFLQQHHEFLETFLEYEGRCNKIHVLLYREPSTDLAYLNGEEVNASVKKRKCCPAQSNVQATIQSGDRAPLSRVTIYVFLCILIYLLVHAVIDIRKEIKSPQQETQKFSLKDYASSSSRRTSVRPRISPVPSLDLDASSAKKPANFSPTRKRSSFSSNSRRPSLAQYLLKGKFFKAFPYIFLIFLFLSFIKKTFKTILDVHHLKSWQKKTPALIQPKSTLESFDIKS